MFRHNSSSEYILRSSLGWQLSLGMLCDAVGTEKRIGLIQDGSSCT